MEKIRLGLINGRHPLPVDNYILEEVADPMNMAAIHVAVYQSLDALLANASNNVLVELYVTGLTSVSIEAIQYFIQNGIEYVAMHYNRDTNSYIPQAGLSML